MKLLPRYLKPFMLQVLIAVALLFGRAACELMLPNLMSDIVNTGIQQSGVEAGLPEALSPNAFELISLFMEESQKAELWQAYQKSPAQGDRAQKFPYAKDKEIYVLSSRPNEDYAELESAYMDAAYAIITCAKDFAAQSGAESPYASGEDAASNADLSRILEIMPTFKALPESGISYYKSQAKAADSLQKSRLGANLTGLFYRELGADMAAFSREYILKTGVKMLGVTLLGVAAAVLTSFFASRISGSVSKRIRHDVFERVTSFSTPEFDKFSAASLITRTTNDVQQVQMLINMGLRMICYSPILGLGGIIMAIRKSPSLSWIIAVAVLVLLGLVSIGLSIAMPRFKKLQKLIDRLNLISRENLTGIMVIRAFGNEAYEEERFEQANRELRDTNRFVQRLMAFMMPSMTLLMNGLSLTIIWIGGHAIARSALQLGDMMAFIQYAMQIIQSFLMIAMMFIMIPRASVSARRIQEVLECEPLVADANVTKPMGNVKGRVEFKNVSFKYSNAESNALEHISFTARPGQTTAFIGSTGSGKSTLVNLIPRFYDVTEGAIEIDGIDIRQVSQKELRQNIGYVPQHGVLFSGDIKSNISYGNPGADEQELVRWLEIAQAKDFVFSKEDGLNSQISQGGTNVSGGQKQRLSIARALAKRPPIFIFDDCFSALDFKTDSALRKALKQNLGDATVLIVAQRISTIMDADQIIVLDNGRVVGKGTHRQLIKECEAYREIALSQLSAEELA